MNYPEPISNLIECFKKLPSIGEKTAERLALSILDLNEDIVKVFSEALLNCKTKIISCSNCNNLSVNDLCPICQDESRNKKVICVVEDPKNIILFERLNIYDGCYYVLNGLISPLDGISPEDIGIPKLINRIKKEQIEEVILALKPTVEGETTSFYISKCLSDCNTKVTKIAHGIPLGADIDYVDSLTLEMALENRKDMTE